MITSQAWLCLARIFSSFIINKNLTFLAAKLSLCTIFFFAIAALKTINSIHSNLDV